VVINAFVAKITHAITSVAISPTVSESQNVGAAHHPGFEIELSRQLLDTLDAGANPALAAECGEQSGLLSWRELHYHGPGREYFVNVRVEL
jgi:hypothetical protein